MESKKIPRQLTLAYYDGEEVGRPNLPKENYATVGMCQWVCDHYKIPYQAVCITEWEDEEIIAQMSVREAVDSNFETSLC